MPRDETSARKAATDGRGDASAMPSPPTLDRPATRLDLGRSPTAVLGASEKSLTDVEAELQLQQVETGTQPCRTLGELEKRQGRR
jgi:hypothetical protein